jgi:hypothetical protein
MILTSSHYWSFDRILHLIMDPPHLMSRKNQTNLNLKTTSIKTNATLRSRKHLLWRLFWGCTRTT